MFPWVLLNCDALLHYQPHSDRKISLVLNTTQKWRPEETREKSRDSLPLVSYTKASSGFFSAGVPSGGILRGAFLFFPEKQTAYSIPRETRLRERALIFSKEINFYLVISHSVPYQPCFVLCRLKFCTHNRRVVGSSVILATLRHQYCRKMCTFSYANASVLIA